jgi:hypothetical protein
MAGAAGADGSGLAIETGNGCVTGVPVGDGCQGTLSVGTIVHATGFDAYEGKSVSASLATPGVLRSSTTSIVGGAFDFNFVIPGPCGLGGSSGYAVGAVYVDVDGDDVCDPRTDLVFVWDTWSVVGEACRVVKLTPDVMDCPIEAGGVNAPVCRAEGTCLDFCGSPSASGGTVLCAAGGEGGTGEGGAATAGAGGGN